MRLSMSFLNLLFHLNLGANSMFKAAQRLITAPPTLSFRCTLTGDGAPSRT
jgi:hypothetical protein